MTHSSFKEKNTQIKKENKIFPHLFVNEKTINYIGNKPDLFFYKDSKKDFNIEDNNNYNSLPDKN